MIITSLFALLDITREEYIIDFLLLVVVALLLIIVFIIRANLILLHDIWMYKRDKENEKRIDEER